MTRQQLEILDCLDTNISSYKARVGNHPNAAQRETLAKMSAARADLARFYSMESLMQEGPPA